MSESPATSRPALVDLNDERVEEVLAGTLDDPGLAPALRQVVEDTLRSPEPVAGFQSSV